MTFYKVAIYIRVSTKEQAESGYSIGEQETRLQKYCDAMQWQVYKVYCDPAYSGATLERPALSELLQDIQQGKIDAVLVWKLDRLSRSQKDTLYLIEDCFIKNDVAFISTLENFDTSTPFGRAMIGILSVFAQLEREQIKERMQLGLDARAKQGLWHGGGFDPYGYDYIDGQLIINDIEAHGVKKVFELFTVKQWSVHKIQQFMNANYSHKYGTFSHDSAIRKILTNTLYIGKLKWKGQEYSAPHTPIIDTETFERAQIILDERKRDYDNRKNPFDPMYLLSGLLYCGNCGARYFVKGNYSGHGEKKRYYPYYTCYSRGKTKSKYIIDPSCKNPSIATEKLDEIILEQIKQLSLDPDAVVKLLKQQKEAITDTSIISKLQSRIDSNTEQIKRLIELCRVGSTLPIQEIAKQIEDIQLEVDKDKRQLENINDDLKGLQIDFEIVKNQFMTAGNIIEKGSYDDKRELIKTLIDKIVITPENELNIFWSFEIKKPC